jgi:hypothetical protein
MFHPPDTFHRTLADGRADTDSDSRHISNSDMARNPTVGSSLFSIPFQAKSHYRWNPVPSQAAPPGQAAANLLRLTSVTVSGQCSQPESGRVRAPAAYSFKFPSPDADIITDFKLNTEGRPRH